MFPSNLKAHLFKWVSLNFSFIHQTRYLSRFDPCYSLTYLLIALLNGTVVFFLVSGLIFWIMLDMRDRNISPTLFKSKPKTFLFKQAFPGAFETFFTGVYK